MTTEFRVLWNGPASTFEDLPKETRSLLTVAKGRARARERAIEKASKQGKSKPRELRCELTKRDILELWNQSNGRCCITGLEFNDRFEQDGPALSRRQSQPWKPSLDRINAEEHYTRNNVRLSTGFANIASGSYGQTCIEEHVLAWADQIKGKQR